MFLLRLSLWLKEGDKGTKSFVHLSPALSTRDPDQAVFTSLLRLSPLSLGQLSTLVRYLLCYHIRRGVQVIMILRWG